MNRLRVVGAIIVVRPKGRARSVGEAFAFSFAVPVAVSFAVPFSGAFALRFSAVGKQRVVRARLV